MLRPRRPSVPTNLTTSILMACLGRNLLPFINSRFRSLSGREPCLKIPPTASPWLLKNLSTKVTRRGSIVIRCSRTPWNKTVPPYRLCRKRCTIKATSRSYISRARPVDPTRNFSTNRENAVSKNSSASTTNPSRRRTSWPARPLLRTTLPFRMETRLPSPDQNLKSELLLFRQLICRESFNLSQFK